MMVSHGQLRVMANYDSDIQDGSMVNCSLSCFIVACNGSYHGGLWFLWEMQDGFSQRILRVYQHHFMYVQPMQVDFQVDVNCILNGSG